MGTILELLNASNKAGDLSLGLALSQYEANRNDVSTEEGRNFEFYRIFMLFKYSLF